MSLIEKLLNKFLPKRVISTCGSPYLHRWFVFRRPWMAIFIHKFVRSDEDRALHDHPWNFLVIPIWRGYIEHSERKRLVHPMCHNSNDGIRFECDGCDGRGFALVPEKRRVCPILGTRFRRAEYKHRVELISDPKQGKFNFQNHTYEAPAWSIFIRFRKRRVWCFWPNGKQTPWNQFEKENHCDDEKESTEKKDTTQARPSSED